MKKLNHGREFWARRRHHQRGQTAIILVLALSLFLLAFTGLAVDYSNLWFHRQAAQGAADAACQAGAMDMYAMATGTTVGGSFKPGFTPKSNTSLDCSANLTATPCEYAVLNGYSGAGLTASAESNDVTFSFPPTIGGITAPPVTLAPVPFMRVDVTDRVKVYLAALITGNKTQDVLATAKCGLVLEKVPVPLVILHPTMSGALHFNGSKASITIYGGPPQSIEVNSDSLTAVSGGGTIDLSQGGPPAPPATTGPGTGSSLGTFGGPPGPTGTFLPGTTGSWMAPSSAVQDPYAQVDAPTKPALAPAPTPVAYNTNGCPDNNNGCLEYHPGDYPLLLKVKNTSVGGNRTAIFDAGIYYLENGISFDSNSMARPSSIDNTANKMGGTLFYLSGTASLYVDANAGSKPTTDSYASSGAICPAAPVGTTVPGNVPANLPGIVLLAPCIGPYGVPLGQYRGILFFQDRSAAASPNWNGGGQVLMSGSMYFHQCNAGGTGTGCLPADYGTLLDLGGNSGSGTYLLGEVITDQMLLHGTPAFAMDLSPNLTYNILKVALLQ
jgi:Putative Flp pilus-assembly TadE/G-like